MKIEKGIKEPISPDTMIYNAMVAVEAECVKRVITQLLKREPTEEDLKLLDREYMIGELHKYILTFHGHPLGYIKKIFEPGKLRVEFSPC